MNLDIIDLMPCLDCRKQQSVLPLSDSAIERRTRANSDELFCADDYCGVPWNFSPLVQKKFENHG